MILWLNQDHMTFILFVCRCGAYDKGCLTADFVAVLPFSTRPLVFIDLLKSLMHETPDFVDDLYGVSVSSALMWADGKRGGWHGDTTPIFFS